MGSCSCRYRMTARYDFLISATNNVAEISGFVKSDSLIGNKALKVSFLHTV